MKEPIKPRDIRAGDTVRVEWTRSQCGSPRALEYVAPHDGTGMRKKMNEAEYSGAQHFLLDRPAPKVELPTEPTLGWLTFFVLGRQQTALDVYYPTQRGLTDEMGGGEWPRESIAAFTPAVAVPKDALDRLREVIERQAGHDDEVDRAAITFLASVDEANGSDR